MQLCTVRAEGLPTFGALILIDISRTNSCDDWQLKTVVHLSEVARPKVVLLEGKLFFRIACMDASCEFWMADLLTALSNRGT